MTQTLNTAAETPSYLLLGVVPGAAAQPASAPSTEAFNPLSGIAPQAPWFLAGVASNVAGQPAATLSGEAFNPTAGL